MGTLLTVVGGTWRGGAAAASFSQRSRAVWSGAVSMRKSPLSAIMLLGGEVVHVCDAYFTLLVRLPDAARGNVPARQPTVAVDPGVDADGVAKVQRHARALRRVAAYHDLAGAVGPRELQF